MAAMASSMVLACSVRPILSGGSRSCTTSSSDVSLIGHKSSLSPIKSAKAVTVYGKQTPLLIHSLFQRRYASLNRWSVIRFSNLHYSLSSPNPNPNPNSLICLDRVEGNICYISDVNTYEKAITLSTPFASKSEDSATWKIVGFLNGLVCLKLHDNNLLVLNPVSEERHLIKLTSLSSINFGFGWDEKVNQNKVISMVGRPLIMQAKKKDEFLQVQVHTLGCSNTWETIATIPNEIFPLIDSSLSGFFFNGNLHWCATDSGPFRMGYMVQGVKTFNVEDQSFGEISIPFKIFAWHFQLGVFRGRLMIVDSSNDDSMRVWVLKDYAVDLPWTLEFVVPMPSQYKSFKLLGVLNNGHLLISCATRPCHINHTDLLSYDPQTKTHKSLKVDGLPATFSAFSHVESVLTFEDVAVMEGL